MLISDETVPLVRAPSLLDEDYRFYAGYNFAARSLRFINSVTLSDHPYVQNVTNASTSMRAVMDGGGYLCIMILIIKRAI